MAQNWICDVGQDRLSWYLDPIDIKTTFALAHSTMNVNSPGFTGDVDHIGVVAAYCMMSTLVDWNFMLIIGTRLQFARHGQTSTQVYTVTHHGE